MYDLKEEGMNEVKEEESRIILIRAPGTSLIEKYQHLKVDQIFFKNITFINCNLSFSLWSP